MPWCQFSQVSLANRGRLSGSLIIESIFSVPGVGGLYLDAINAMDYDAFMFLSGFYILLLDY